METIRDVHNRVACYGNPTTGVIEFKDRNQKITVNLPVGGIFIVEKKGARTKVIRPDPSHFKIVKTITAA